MFSTPDKCHPSEFDPLNRHPARRRMVVTDAARTYYDRRRPSEFGDTGQ
jgi:hypothetical protein